MMTVPLPFKHYLVGGAVRDHLLGLPRADRDWVVVGGTPDAMVQLGFKPVGKDFPVFLHPETHEEYALARTERKSGRGYKGFHFLADANVTLEEDLKRRDLTINAMAEDPVSGKIIDPFGGADDLAAKVLRHVSPAFIEDPLRLLRAARFAARFDFTVDKKTLVLLRDIAHSGELSALVPERVWVELDSALASPLPQRFFEVLQRCDALPILFPEIAPQFTNTTTATPLALLINAARALTADSEVILAMLLHRLSEQDILVFAERYRIPRRHRDLALLVAHHHRIVLDSELPTAEALLALFSATDLFRRPTRFQQFLVCCRAIATRTSENAQKHVALLDKAAKTIAQVSPGNVSARNDGLEIARELKKKRLSVLQKITVTSL